MIRLVALLLAITWTFNAQPAAAEGTESCGSVVILGQANTHCVKSGSETNAYIAHHSDHVFTIDPACEIGGAALCSQPAACHIHQRDGMLFNVREDGVLLDWQACLTDAEAGHLGAITPAQIEKEFRRLAWPASPLVVQPPNGRTLVNFDTNFYTTNTRPTTKSVTLLGRRITIEATPVQYTYRFADGAAQTTSDPGAAYPDLRVTYRYPGAGTVSPAVDTTYAGRYRIGNSQWRTIPATLTVAGQAQQLAVLTATPHLVGY